MTDDPKRAAAVEALRYWNAENVGTERVFDALRDAWRADFAAYLRAPSDPPRDGEVTHAIVKDVLRDRTTAPSEDGEGCRVKIGVAISDHRCDRGTLGCIEEHDAPSEEGDGPEVDTSDWQVPPEPESVLREKLAAADRRIDELDANALDDGKRIETLTGALSIATGKLAEAERRIAELEAERDGLTAKLEARDLDLNACARVVSKHGSWRSMADAMEWLDTERDTAVKRAEEAVRQLGVAEREMGESFERWERSAHANAALERDLAEAWRWIECGRSWAERQRVMHAKTRQELEQARAALREARTALVYAESGAQHPGAYGRAIEAIDASLPAPAKAERSPGLCARCGRACDPETVLCLGCATKDEPAPAKVEDGVVMWGGRRMREGKCPPGNTCLACDRLRSHLEPAETCTPSPDAEKPKRWGIWHGDWQRDNDGAIDEMTEAEARENAANNARVWPRESFEARSLPDDAAGKDERR